MRIVYCFLVALTVLSLLAPSQAILAQCDPDWARDLFATEGLGGTTYAYANSLCVFRDQMYVGGTFLAAGNLSVNYIARWNGSSWQGVGSGVNGYVQAMCEYDGELYVGGHFTSAGGIEANFIAKWDGQNWSPVGVGTDGPVLALCVYNGELYAGGAFTAAGGIPALHIAKWNGSSWNAVGSGLDGGAFPYVFALCVYNGELYAGGGFQRAGNVNVPYVARWNGEEWRALTSGVNNFVQSLCVFDGKLCAGGDFTLAGGMPAARIACWDGSSWQSLGSGMNQSVRALLEFDGKLYAAGAFTTAGGVQASRIAVWDGSSWQSLGNGIGGEYPVVYALCDYTDGIGPGKALYVGGYFSSAGGYDSLCIARWGCESAVMTIPEAKLSFDNRLVTLTGVVSTMADQPVFYVSEVTEGIQVSGIRVEMEDNNLTAGQRVNLIGRLATNSNGERYIRAWSAQAIEPATARPFYLVAKNLGGGPFGFAGGAGQEGVTGGVGLNNIGLLVKVFGRFTYVDSNTFLLDDGSAQVKCAVTPDITIDPSWQYVVVTGIVSCIRDQQGIHPQLIVSSVEDISALDQR